MANSFTFYGKIGAMKKTDSFEPINRRNFDSGWTQTTVNFNCISGTNRIRCVVQGGKWIDDRKNVIHTFTDATNPTTGKRDKLDVAWNDRFNPEIIESVAPFRRFTVDTGDADRRRVLEKAVEAFKRGTITDKLMDESGCFTVAEVESALEKINNKKHVFLSEYDFAEFCAKLVESDKIKDYIFKISGAQEIQYSAPKDQFYSNYRVNTIELAKLDTEIKATMNVDFYFTEDALMADNFEETGKAIVSGWTTYYDSMVKKNGFCPINIVVRGKDSLNSVKRKLTMGDSGASIRNIGFIVDVIEGSEINAITYDDLDEETKMDVDEGLLLLEDAIAALGGNKFGDRISELRFTGLNSHKSKAEDTTSEVENMHRALPDKKKEEAVDISDDDDEL